MKTQLKLFEWKQEGFLSYEYFFLISPPYPIRQIVKGFKHKMHHEIGLSDFNMLSVPHISLLLNPEIERHDKDIIERGHKALMKAGNFRVNIDGPDFFTHSETNSVFLKVRNSDPLQKMFNALHKEFDHFFPEELETDFNPHLTIARSIPRDNFNKISYSLNEYDLKTEFTCHTITLLVREVSTFGKKVLKGKYEKIYDYYLRKD
jgi:2'-5' RNA ligase